MACSWFLKHIHKHPGHHPVMADILFHEDSVFHEYIILFVEGRYS